MTKIGKILGLVFVSAIIVSCGGPQGEKAATGEAQEVTVKNGDVTLAVDQSASGVEWIGTKPTGQHNGTVNISNGELMLKDGEVVGGKFTIDLNSIVVLDLTDQEMNAKLLGHLKSADFFEVETYPTAVFEITSVSALSGNPEASHNITGNLTMKDVTKSVTFPAMINVSDDSVTAVTPAFIIDRTEWNVQYGSRKLFDNLKDNFIHDEMSLKINLKAVV
jgi:polyisoprenoid-binding protein YceI